MKLRIAIIALVLSLFTGCSSLFPKKVEFFQDKVEKFPVAKGREREVQRQAAQRAAEKAEETLKAALAEGSTPAVVKPADETSKLTDSVSRSLGPPLSPSDDKSEVLARKLDRAIAKLNERIDDFKADNDKNVGHKIEDTGLLKIPYFAWLGVVGAAILLVHLILKTVVNVAAAGNPAVALGMNAVQLGGRGAAALAKEVIHGGEIFKDLVAKELPEVEAKVKELFTTAQMKAQSPANQVVVKNLTS